MPRLIWDNTAERVFYTGVDHGVLYLVDKNNAYTGGVVWNGLTQVTESPDGAEATDLWADNIKYASFRSAEKFGGTIEAYMFPNEFCECDGGKELLPGVRVGQQPRRKFGLCYRTKIGDDLHGDSAGYELHLVYGATASPTDKQYQTTNDSPDAATMSWEFEADPVVVTGEKPTANLVIDSRLVDADKLAKLEDVLYGTYEKLTSSPDDWSTNYKNYFELDAQTNIYKPVTGSVAPSWMANKYYKAVDARLPLPDEVKSILSAA